MTMMATQHPVDDIVAEAALLEDDFTETKQQQEHSDESHAEGMMIASSTTKEEEEGENRTGTTIEARTYDGSTETFTANTIATNTPASQYTPPRSSLATDSHLTPIASIKRPLKRTTTGGSLSRTPPVPHTPSNTTMTRADSFPKKQQQHTPLTPMHKIKAVHRSESDEAVSQKVDVLFSPVVQFLHENGHEDHEDDVSMTRLEQADNDEFNPWQFIQSLPPYESVVASRPPVTLPPRSLLNNKYKPLDQPPVMKKTLVLDLDETLVHCTVQVVTDADFVFPVQFHGEVYQVYVKCRPYLQDFLAAVAPYFEIVVFTASQKVYADALLNILDPGTYKYNLG